MSKTIYDLAILIVDDEPNVLRMLVTVLQRAGYQHLYAVASAVEALRLMGVPHPAVVDPLPEEERLRPDLLVTDIVLPDLSGFDLCQKVKKQVRPRYLPVLLLTGLNIEDYDARFLDSGADDFLFKPLTPAELVARTSLLLRRKLTHEEAAERPESEPQAFSLPQELARHPAMTMRGQFVGRYCVDTTVAWGGSTLVYRASDSSGTRVCLKLLSQQASESEDVKARFLREAQMMRELDHEGIVKVLDIGHYQHCPFYVMEFLDGQDLERLLESLQQQASRLDAAEARRIGLHVADALAYVHRHRVIHRDIKPKNIHRLVDGRIKLGDFGIAVGLSDSRLTQVGYTVGTPMYMAPEQFDADQPVTPAIDIYGFGATLYHLLAGRPPFHHGNPMEVMRSHQRDAPPPLAAARDDLGAPWEELVCRRCLAKRPEDRPASMEAVRDALAALPG